MKRPWTWESFRKRLAPSSGCLVWTGKRNENGYGALQVRYRWTRAHRLAWTLTKGDIPDGMCVLHRCDNPPCCNPEHLFLGTRGDNATDKAIKQRTGVSKLTPMNVLAIRDAFAKGETQTSLAVKFGVHQTSISSVVKNEVWAWVRPTR